MTIERMTYRDCIRRYSDLVDRGHADTDLSPRLRRLVVTMLNLASNYGMTYIQYPPADSTRDETVKYLDNILWDARPLMYAVSPSSVEASDDAQTRVIAILRGC